MIIFNKEEFIPKNEPYYTKKVLSKSLSIVPRKMSSGILLRLKLTSNYANCAISFVENVLLDKEAFDKNLINKFMIKHDLSSLKDASSRINIDITHREFISRIPEIHDDIMSAYVMISEFLSDFTNTVLFRNYTVSGRKISTINSKMSLGARNKFKEIHKMEEKYFYKFLTSSKLSSFFIKHTTREYIRVSSSAVGFISGVSHIDVVKYHPMNFITTLDVSKFFNSVNTSKFIKYDLFKKHLMKDIGKYNNINNEISSRFLNTPLKLSKSIDSYNMVSINDLISVYSNILNLTMSFLTHNGQLPTGAPYSPSLSNIYMSQFDTEISNHIGEYVSNFDFQDNNNRISVHLTRYADDITISSNSSVISSMEFIKHVEVLVRKFDLYLKYEKTNIFDRSKGNASIMGLSVRKEGDASIYTGSKYRKETIDIVKPLANIDNLSSSEIGKISYFLLNPDAIFDLATHINFDNKKVPKELTPASNEDFSHLLTLSSLFLDFSFREMSDNYAAYIPPSSKMTYKDIIFKMRESSSRAPNVMSTNVANIHYLNRTPFIRLMDSIDSDVDLIAKIKIFLFVRDYLSIDTLMGENIDGVIGIHKDISSGDIYIHINFSVNKKIKWKYGTLNAPKDSVYDYWTRAFKFSEDMIESIKIGKK